MRKALRVTTESAQVQGRGSALGPQELGGRRMGGEGLPNQRIDGAVGGIDQEVLGQLPNGGWDQDSLLVGTIKIGQLPIEHSHQQQHLPSLWAKLVQGLKEAIIGSSRCIQLAGKL